MNTPEIKEIKSKDSLLTAAKNEDDEKIKELEAKANSGEIIRLW